MHPTSKHDNDQYQPLSDVPLSDIDIQGPWSLARPSPQVIQQHYVQARVHEINMTMGDKNREATIDLLLGVCASQIKGTSKGDKRKYCTAAYKTFNENLQNCDLTINLEASSWFSAENPYDTYAQMYERAVDGTTGQMLLADDKKNTAKDRAFADDLSTFPQHWGGAGGVGSQRGLMPGALQPGHAIAQRMLAGASIPANFGDDRDRHMNEVKKSDGSTAYTSENQKFDPRTKQVIAALNYGKRVHGSCVYYGESYLLLKPNLKRDAIYFAGDTFGCQGAHEQASYDYLATLYLHAKPGLRQLLVATCLYKSSMTDTADAGDLVEAHIFSTVYFSRDVVALYLKSTTDRNVLANAKKFCNKRGIKLVQNS